MGKKGDDTPPSKLQGQKTNSLSHKHVEGFQRIPQSSQHGGAKHLGQESSEVTQVSCAKL